MKAKTLVALALAFLPHAADAVALQSTAFVLLDGLPLAQNEGTITASATGSERRENGSVSGTALANSSYGTLAVFAQFTHAAFEGTVVTEIGLAQAAASFRDRVRIDTGPTALMAFVFDLEGQAFGPESEAYAAFRFNDGLLAQTQTSVQVQTPFIELRPGEPVDVFFELIAYAGRQNSDLGTSRVEFDRTLRLTGILATDLDGSPIDIDLIADSGMKYGSLPAGVPDSGGGFVLLGVSGAGLMLAAHRRNCAARAPISRGW